MFRKSRTDEDLLSASIFYIVKGRLTFCFCPSVAVISPSGLLKLFAQILAAWPLGTFCLPPLSRKS